ncbi:MAG: hypothetical protein SPJ97_00635 [Bacteroides sp.]|nr:hypothetical protein [Bacteroides sp.]
MPGWLDTQTQFTQAYEFVVLHSMDNGHLPIASSAVYNRSCGNRLLKTAIASLFHQKPGAVGQRKANGVGKCRYLVL